MKPKNHQQKIDIQVLSYKKIYIFQIAKQQLKHETKIAPGRKECTIWEIYQIKRPDIGNDMIKKFAESEIQGDRELEDHKNFIERSLRA